MLTNYFKVTGKGGGGTIFDTFVFDANTETSAEKAYAAARARCEVLGGGFARVRVVVWKYCKTFGQLPVIGENPLRVGHPEDFKE